MTEDLPVFDYLGDFASFGESYGEHCRDRIPNFQSDLYDNISRKLEFSHPPSRLEEFLSSNWRLARQMDPDVGAVIDGIARGANQPAAAIEALCSFMDVISLRSATVREGVLGCTVVSGHIDEVPVLAQNYDMERFYADHAIAINAVLTDRPGYAAFSFVGIPACVGLSSSGYALGFNFLHCGDIRQPGMPHASTVLRVLLAGSIGEALGSVLHGPRACGGHYLILDETGVGISLEVSATAMANRDVTGTWFVHTNHYLSEALSPLDELLYTPSLRSAPARRGSSLFRRARAEQLISRSTPTNSDDVLRVLSDTCNSPMGICSNTDNVGEPDAPSTIASLFASPVDRTLQIDQWLPERSRRLLIPR